MFVEKKRRRSGDTRRKNRYNKNYIEAEIIVEILVEKFVEGKKENIIE